MALNDQWNLKSRAHACHATGQPFIEGETFFTALFRSADAAGLERRDYSEEAWKNLEADSPAPFSHWRSVYTPPARAPKQEDPMQRESAEELLRRLVQEDEAHTENARFILAVMLERQKLLRQTDVNKIGETRLLIYEHRKSGEVLLVRDPDIPLADVDRVTAEVTALLEAQQPQEPGSTR